jgi:predicted outer membrane repeat protein
MAFSLFTVLIGTLAGCGGGESCTFEGDTFCMEGQVYTMDSCGNYLEQKETCQCGCNAEHTACANCGCIDTCQALGDSQCVNGRIRTCETGSDGCLHWSDYMACPRGRCLDSTSCVACEDECIQPNLTECANGRIRTCEAGADGCLDWSSFSACPDGFCADATSCGTCDDRCGPIHATQCANGRFRTCVADQNGCLDWSDWSPCPEGFCQDEFVCGGCANDCVMGESQCDLASGRIRYCEPDQHGCLVWGGYASCEDGFCEDDTTCGTCQNPCGPEGVTECTGGEYRTCIQDENGCLIWGPYRACDQGACANDESCLECVDGDEDGHDATGASCPAGDDHCDDDASNWTANGCANCVDNDGDGYGDQCDLGPDCDDENDTVWGACPFCGDGDVDPDEACDDGDNDDNDGCSAQCDVESGYICQGEPSDCVYKDAIVYYVDDDAPAGGDGSRWSQAFNLLSLALDAASDALNTHSWVEIWVGEGTYYPYPEQRFSSLALMDNLTLYGGFDGLTHHSLGQRDFAQYPTILSGDIGTRGLQDDNVYHVIRADGVTTNCLVDGIIIQNGYARDNDDPMGEDGSGLLAQDSQLTLRNCTFSSNEAYKNGGGIYTANSVINLENCTFEGNEAASRYGGGVYSLESDIDLTDCTFTDNYADKRGAGVYAEGGILDVSNCHLESNRIYFSNYYESCRGAGICHLNGTLVVTDSSFHTNRITTNYSSGGKGGAVYISNGTAEIYSSTFGHNYLLATGDNEYIGFGGGLYAGANSDISLIGCTFTENTAGDGGGVFLYNNSNLEARDCNFMGNRADPGHFDGDGGAIYQNGGSQLIADCLFDDNSSTEKGGAVHSTNGRSTHVRNTFIANQTRRRGGAISVSGIATDYTGPEIVNCIFSGNSASYYTSSGGGIYFARATPLVTNCLFSANLADDYGGGVHLKDSDGLLTNCTFAENTAETACGLYVEDSIAGVENSIFWNEGDCLQISGNITENISVTYSCVDGGYVGVGNVDFCEPAFVDADGIDNMAGTIDDDLGLLPTSDCIDVGYNAALPADLHDVDQDNNTSETLPIDLVGNPRVVNTTVDIGAYEAQ